MIDYNPARKPDETYDAYKSRMRVGRLELDKHMRGTPVVPMISGNKKLLQVISKERGAKKRAMQALGVTSGKKLRKMMKKERRSKNA